ncbi:hypothetical protein TVAG_100070 [Trichomonas vaginalis G3]|uniref:E3 ubiquitin protein ligase n=1 Tax=Trichomonas vaginalis (strain ATCC PRA-98 / G3) TaxID=412133 RepID=A2EK74_TRIV3|nr:RING finger protein-related family [Trichomonas vaginalis G3]EAY06967.1 hypothetical protein TVAG_100070 [Trichomonas vaginalis G3]KAI5499117.1 RING finger protein-related family [Trichomonas vaginalis G3]|eukprot:XP_001319190.1 hypothetical protein [Trichomonas vaginalis G3]
MFFQELLAGSLDSALNLLNSLEDLETMSDQSISELRILVTSIFKLINQDMPQFDGGRFMVQFFSQYSNDDPDIQRVANDLNKFRSLYKQILQTREQIALLHYNLNLFHEYTRIFGELAPSFDELKGNISSFEPKSVDAYVEKTGPREYSPVPNIYSHEYEKRLFSADFQPIDSIYISRFLQRIRPNDESSIVMNTNILLSSTSEMLEKLIEMKYETDYDIQMGNIIYKYPERDIVLNHQFSKQLIKQNKSFESIINHDDDIAVLSRTNMLKNASILYDMATSLDDYFVESDNQTNYLPVIAAKVNAVDNKIRSIRYINNLLRKSQYVPLSQGIQPILDYIELQHKMESLFNDIITNGFENKHLGEIDTIITELGEIKKRFTDAKREISKVLKDKEYQLTILKNTTPLPPPDVTALNVTRERAFNMSKAVIKAVDEAMEGRMKLKEGIMNCINTISTIEPPIPYSIVVNEDDTQYNDTITWLKSIRDDLQNYVDNLKQEIAEKDKIINKEPSRVNSTTGQMIIQGSDEIYNELRAIVSCPLCEREATHCLGKCGHILCADCVDKVVTSDTFVCPVCGCQSVKADIIAIKW